VTTGTPISLLIENVDQRSKDYGEIARTSTVPATPTITYDDQNTACATIAAAAALGARDRGARRRRGGGAQVVPGVTSAARWCRSARTRSTAPTGTGTRSSKTLLLRRTPVDRAGLGRIISTASARRLLHRRGDRGRRRGRAAGWGAPIYGKLDADTRLGLMSINAVKGVEIGAASPPPRSPAKRTPTRCAWATTAIRLFLSNNAGGILGGISTGAARRRALRGQADLVDPHAAPDHRPRAGEGDRHRTKGRHDPCVGIRAVPVGEAMMACVLADHYLFCVCLVPPHNKIRTTLPRFMK
jgi:chorismate synthase